MLEMASEAATKRGNHFMSNTAGARIQQYTNILVFRLAQMMFCVLTLRQFLPFDGPSMTFQML